MSPETWVFRIVLQNVHDLMNVRSILAAADATHDHNSMQQNPKVPSGGLLHSLLKISFSYVLVVLPCPHEPKVSRP